MKILWLLGLVLLCTACVKEQSCYCEGEDPLNNQVYIFESKNSEAEEACDAYEQLQGMDCELQ